MYRNKRYPPGHCDDCGTLLVEIAPRTFYSPADYGCPRCDGGVDPNAHVPDEDDIADERYHAMKNEGEIR